MRQHLTNSGIQDSYNHRIRTIWLDSNSTESKRQEILSYFHQTFSLYEDLFSIINAEQAFYLTADPLRHPLIFYYGHTAVFYMNKLILMKQITQRLNPKFESMFAIGVDEMSWDDLNQAHYSWPSVRAVKRYRDKVRQVVSQYISDMDLSLPIRWSDPSWVILMGIEHERIHLETTSVLIRQLPLRYVSERAPWLCCDVSSEAPNNALVFVEGGDITLGKSLDDNTYGWDNEYGEFSTQVDPFYASQCLVSNGEFLAFVHDGGYAQQQWWTEEGWRWREYCKASMPRFWMKHLGDYFLRLMNKEIPMPWNWPVEVNYLESKAFCNWLSHKKNQPIRLPTEAEWYLLASTIKEVYPLWELPVGNIDLCYFASPCPVDWFKQGQFYDVIGNVWQWTETSMNPFSGFKVHEAYDDFSIPTFDGKHNLIKGGSWISTGNEATLKSRYAFRRHFYQYAGFRYVQSEQPCYTVNHHYETDKLLSEYLEFHYGPDYFDVPNFQKNLVTRALSYMDKSHLNKAMDLGCAVGRASFELSKVFSSVYGVDFSTGFIKTATQLQTTGRYHYTIPIEGEICDYRECHLEEMGVDNATASKIHFIQGDACNLKAYLNEFDLILAANLIDRLYDPYVFIETIHERLKLGGILLVSSPYTWLEDYTSKDKWFGGIKKDGENLTSFSHMQTVLGEHFMLMEEPLDVPFVIRETQRKFQHSVAEVTVWKRVK